nr:hypothetical protein [Tanacetum cinerariifolium]
MPSILFKPSDHRSGDRVLSYGKALPHISLCYSIEEDGTLEIVNPKDLLGCDPLALVDKFTPVEGNIGLLETTFDEDDVLMFVFPEDVTGSVNLTRLFCSSKLQPLAYHLNC